MAVKYQVNIVTAGTARQNIVRVVNIQNEKVSLLL
jgi:hypothetical protein